MRLQVADGVLDQFPDLRVAVILAEDVDNTGSDPLDAAKRAAATRMHEEWTEAALAELPAISAWRDAYRAFGVKPKSSRPTAEALLRRLIKGEPFPTISKAVDAYLLVETEFHLPIGGYDTDRIAGDIQLRHSVGDEPFLPLGASAPEVTRPGEVIYADAERVLTRKWNFRDCDECKIVEGSTNIALFTEAPFATISADELAASAERIAQNIQTYCGGKTRVDLLDCSERTEVLLR